MKRTLVIGWLALGAAAALGWPVGCSDDCSANCTEECNQNCQCASQALTVNGCFNKCNASTAQSSCGPPMACMDGLCVYQGVRACESDGECVADGGGAGSRCIDGRCLGAAGLCVDRTQCRANDRCVAGACVPSCNATSRCPTGYACDTTIDVCTGNPSPCADDDGGATCAAGTTCIERHCVPRCAGRTGCSEDQICVEHFEGIPRGGCIPDQSLALVCSGDGVQDACPSGSICLREACYVACEPEAAASCDAATGFPDCKAVSTPSGIHHVCGSSTNLGTECDPTRSPPLACASGSICIDGYCR